jgi:hypothetical protein
MAEFSYESRCACGHPLSAHHRTPKGRRTYCCTGTAAGNCACKLFEPVPEVRDVRGR